MRNPESTVELGDDNEWPKVEQEDDFWSLGYERSYSNREREQQTGVYKRSVPPQISAAKFALSSEVASDVAEASSEIARFDAEMGRELGSFGAILLRSESLSSSRIEQLTASARAIATAESGAAGSSSNAELIVANTHAMQRAIELASQLDVDSIRTIHRTLMQTEMTNAGEWRTVQNWIGPGRSGPRMADFVPPSPERVPKLMDDLVAFMDRTDVPVIASAAISHAQFETIHPFEDGNGRTGRAMLHAYLRRKGLTTSATVPISAGLLANVGSYFDALSHYRDGQPNAIIAQVAQASVHAVGLGRDLVHDLRSVRESWNDKLIVRRNSDAWRLADLLVSRPVVTRESVARDLGVLENNVDRAIRPLVDAGILVASGAASRGRKVWRSPEVLAELDAFAERLGRRASSF